MKIIIKSTVFILISVIIVAYFYSYPPLPFFENFWQARIWKKPPIPPEIEAAYDTEVNATTTTTTEAVTTTTTIIETTTTTAPTTETTATTTITTSTTAETTATTTATTTTEEIIEPPEEPTVEISEPMPPLPPPPPPLSVRKFQKNISLDKRAVHRCEAEVFRVNLSGRSSASGRIILRKDADISYEVEIGSLPEGIDITFSRNKDYLYQPQADETTLNLEITNEAGSQKGNFSIPIIYTKTGSQNSTAICQINVINF